MEERDDKGKPLHSLADLLADDQAPQAPASQPKFRSLATPGIRTMKIPDNGIW